MKNEIIKLTDEQYFSSSGVSNSFLIRFDKSPLHAVSQKETTKAMMEGSINHHYILDLETFFNNYYILPEEVKVQNTKFGNYKDWLEKNKLSHEKDFDKIIKYKDMNEIKEANKAIIDNLVNYNLGEEYGRFNKYYQESQKEISVFWEDVGIQRKAKLDMLWHGDSRFIIFDLKFCQDAIDWQWNLIAQGKNNAYKYYRQVASYLTGAEKILEKPGIFIFIAVEKKSPYAVKAYIIEDDYIEHGKKEDLKSLLNYKNWFDIGSPLYCYSGINVIEKPKYLE